MPVSKEDQVRLEERRTRVSAMYLSGVPQYQIAVNVGVHRGQIARDLDAIRLEWRAARLATFEEKLDRELAKIDRLESVAFEAWERSCRDGVTLHAETTKGRATKEGMPLPDLAKTAKTSKGQAGDPAFLSQIRWCIETRLKLIGALKQDGATQVTVTTVIGGVDLDAVLGRKPGIDFKRATAPGNN